ncbi:hypothetical protein [Nocardia transvalensis]|uniref:hypothetical protein n=1 Tax=Nocardia transvalensis TaxID=37333 RepID=UPI001894F056|nr:hypothetical protein [Nocardia transvalensis]MBF6331490.1 hypothetical protein [Nocardia transvalensis]
MSTKKIAAAVVAAAGLAGTAAVAVPASTAAADFPAFLTCTETQDVTYDPPLTNTVRETKATVTRGLGTEADVPVPCLGVGTTIIWGESEDKSTQPRSCLELTAPGATQVEATIRWSDGSKSTFRSTTRTVVRGEGTTVLQNTGTIVSGQFEGQPAVETLAAPNPDLTACKGEGIRSLTFEGDFTIAPG